MTPLLQIAAFAVGVYLSIHMIAALYAVIDLWYAIGRAYPRVLRGILVWAGAIFASAWLLEQPYRMALAWGLAGFLVFYLSLYVIRHPVLRALRRSQERADALQDLPAGGVSPSK